MKLKYILLSALTILNYNLVDYYPVIFLKSFSFLFIQILIIFVYLGSYNEREVEYRRVCWQNYSLYLQNLFLSDRIKNLRDVIDSIYEENVKKMSQYQRKIGMCQFPYCDNKPDEIGLCKNHCKYQRDDCAICLERFSEEYYPLSCGHFLHQECLRKSGDNRCSLCRRENKYF